jgi:adenylosuccinate synthase
VDLVALRYAIMINGVTDLVMMKADVLDGFETIKVCVAYEKDGVRTETMPYDTEGWTAVYEELPGWHTPLTEVRREADFPKAYADYVRYLEQALGTPISILSVGPDREATIVR